MHHKMAVIDGNLVVSGSYNWTNGGTSKNDENLLVLDDVAPVFGAEFERLWGAAKSTGTVNQSSSRGPQ